MPGRRLVEGVLMSPILNVFLRMYSTSNKMDDGGFDALLY